MRRFSSPALLLLLLGSPLYAQSMAVYSPVTRATSISYASIASTGTSVAAWRNGVSTDDNRSMPVPIGFAFYYDGQAFTQFSISTNGFLDLSSSTAPGSGNGAYGFSNAQFSTPGGTLLAVAPIYDDLVTQGNPGNQLSLTQSMKYLLSGSPPDRVLTVEWINLQVHGDVTPSLNFQVKLHESSGVVEIIYGSMTPGTGAFSYTSGINGASMSAMPNGIELLTQQSANTDDFGSLPQNALSSVPESNTMLTFTPAQHVTPAAPSSLTFSDVTQTSFTVGWSDASTTETYFVVQRAVDGGSFETIAVPASTTTAATGGLYALDQQDLSPGKTYDYRITANNEASAPSGYLTGGQMTDPPGAVTSVASGNWSEPSTWSGNAVPAATDAVVIADGDTVYIDVGSSCWNLTVGEGVSGLLEFEAGSARNLKVGNDFTITAGATLRTASSGTVTTHGLQVGGNLVNNGVLDLSTNSNLAGAAIMFVGAGTASFTGSGPTTDLRLVIVNKGVSRASLLHIAPDVLTVRGSVNDVAGFLALMNGVAELGGSFTLTSRVFTVPAYFIASTAGLWLNNPNVTIAGQNGMPTNNGLIRVTQGIYNVGTFSVNSMTAGAGAEFVIEGGTLTFSGRLSTASAVTYNQSGGVVNVANAGNPSSGVGSFDLSSTSTNFIMSGGAICLVQPSTAASTRLDYKISTTIVSLTGGTLQIGTSSTVAGAHFNIVGPVPNLLVDNSTGGRVAVLFANVPATKVHRNTTITPGSTLDLGGFTLNQLGSDFTNDGTLAGAAPGSRIRFQGSEGPQGYGGSGGLTGALDGLIVDNPAGVTISPAIPANVAVLRVELQRGVLTNSSRITLGNGGATAAVTQIGAAGLEAAGGSYDQAPVFNPGSAGCSVLYMDESTPRTTGFEIPPSRSLANLTIAHANGVTLSGGALGVTSSLTLTSGTLTTSASDPLTLANSVANPPAGSPASYVDGPLAIEFNVASPVDRAFAIGKSGAFRPLLLKQVNTGGVSRTFTAEVLDGPAGSPTPPLAALDPARYWTVTNTGQLNASARVRLAFGSDDGVLAIADTRVAQSASAGGNYATLGGAATGTPSSGTVESTANLTPGAGFFTVGLQIDGFVWDGGASTTFWGDAANWYPNAVPAGTDNVILNAGAPTTIDVNGSFACDSLVVGPNITLNLGTGSLSLGGGYTQLGGAVHVGSGALHVAGPLSLFAGDLSTESGEARGGATTRIYGGNAHLAGTGRLLALGAFTQSGGALELGDGVLELRGAILFTGGSFDAGTGKTLLSGTSAQSLGGGVTHHDLVLGGSGAKRFTGGAVFTISNDFDVQPTVQLALTEGVPTTITVGGDFRYAGTPGGSHLESLTVDLTGTGKLIGGAAAKRSGAAQLPRGIATIERSERTGPREISVQVGPDGAKRVSGLRNTYALKGTEAAGLLSGIDAGARAIVNLDDATLIRNPARLAPLSPPSQFEMAVTVKAGADYALEDDATIAAARALTVSGRLDCGNFVLDGSGAVIVTPGGVLATAATDTSGLAATVLAAGPNRYDDGAAIEYSAAGDQTISVANHPASAMIYTSGGGTKTLSGDKTITGSSGPALTRGALLVGAGTTFHDAGHRLSFVSSGFANVIVDGVYASDPGGALSYESGPYLSNIRAVDGTSFGDLLLNFDSSTHAVELNATGTADISFRNVIFGGTEGIGTAGGTLRLNESGITNVTVTGGVLLSPADSANTGGGFGGTASTTGAVAVSGDVVSTSLAAAQPIMNGTGTNTFSMNGASMQGLTISAGATLFAGSTLRVANPAGIALGGSGLVYAIGGGLDLTGGNVTTGGNVLSVAGAVTRSSGHVVGALRKAVAGGIAQGASFEIGTGADYTPVEALFDTVAVAGDVTATVAASDHPLIGSSALDATKNANRYWNLSGPALEFSHCEATFHFASGDLDAGADPDSFMVARYGSSTWTLEGVGARSATSTQAVGVTSLGEFAVGQGGVFTITATAGPGGSIAPSGIVSVPAGADRGFTITPLPGHHIADVLVDTTSAGAVAVYTFTSVAEDHTIHAEFAPDVDLVEARTPEGACLSSASTCVEVPVVLAREDTTALRAFSVMLQLGGGLELCGPPDSSIVEGPYLGSLGGDTAFLVVSNGGGSYQVDGSLLGWPCGPAGDGAIFTIDVTSDAPSGSGTITITGVVLRDCINQEIQGAPGEVASVDIDNTPPDAVASLAAAQVKAGNDADGTTKIRVTFTPPVDAAALEVYRAGFGSYPEYDDPPTAGSPPAAPGYPPGPPWILTGVTASGQTDEPPARDLWYYAAFAKDSAGNLSGASTLTAGTLNYHLGDVHDGLTECAGDNGVSTADVSYLGAHYGAALGLSDPLACLDVGPTEDRWVDTRPLTDDLIQFEDLMMFAVNYSAVAKGVTKPLPASVDELSVSAASSVDLGQVFTAVILASGTGRVQGYSVGLAWDANVVEPVSMSPGALTGPNGAVAWTPAAGTVDAAVLGLSEGGFTGAGVLAEVTFHAIAAGAPRIAIGSVEARDGRNRSISIGVVSAPVLAPTATGLIACAPNPFVPSTTVRFSLARSAPVDVSIFSVDGRRVRTLASGVRPAGEHRVVWDGRDERGARVSSGVYFARFSAAGITHTRAVTLLK